MKFTHPAHARWYIAAQRHNPLHALGLQVVQNLQNRLTRCAHARQMRRGIKPHGANIGHRCKRTVLGRTARAVSAREKIRLERGQSVHRLGELFNALRRFWREKFKADGNIEAHGCPI